ncbi:SH3 domain-containing protein [Clostridium frigoris]|uniref:SH3 domain-containing protein n=1 Tax=Clostridium frigoris TaxID=205327 RepID=A0ABS6BVY5_9CLOT|nr:GH25 family lysozyme [Clostridium frigoris]MBU3160665.1 SH3 domain-containing protein [Clostridium frigoris]
MSNYNGIDVSSYQGFIDFAKVKGNGINIVYIKATQGTGYINPMLKEYYQGAKFNGLKIGFYHFLTHSSSSLQAQHFLNSINGLVSDCKYIIDVEGTWTIAQASKVTREFADYLISKNKEVGIYTGDYFYRDNLNSTVKNLPVWIANYGGVIMAPKYSGHQYTDKGAVRGITGNVDMNKFNDAILLTPKIVPTIVKTVATPKTTGIVTANVLNVRSGAGAGYKVIGQLKKGDKVKIDKKVNNFYSIYFGIHGGYVSVDYIK